jgi:hypothetical protein
MTKDEPTNLEHQSNAGQGKKDRKVHLDGKRDALLSRDATHLWVEVRNIAVYIRQADEGVAVDLYANHAEDGEALASTWATYAEAEEGDD